MTFSILLKKGSNRRKTLLNWPKSPRKRALDGKHLLIDHVLLMLMENTLPLTTLRTHRHPLLALYVREMWRLPSCKNFP